VGNGYTAVTRSWDPRFSSKGVNRRKLLAFKQETSSSLSILTRGLLVQDTMEIWE